MAGWKSKIEQGRTSPSDQQYIPALRTSRGQVLPKTSSPWLSLGSTMGAAEYLPHWPCLHQWWPELRAHHEPWICCTYWFTSLDEEDRTARDCVQLEKMDQNRSRLHRWSYQCAVLREQSEDMSQASLRYGGFRIRASDRQIHGEAVSLTWRAWPQVDPDPRPSVRERWGHSGRCGARSARGEVRFGTADLGRKQARHGKDFQWKLSRKLNRWLT